MADLDRQLATENRRSLALEARLGLLEKELAEAEAGEVHWGPCFIFPWFSSRELSFFPRERAGAINGVDRVCLVPVSCSVLRVGMYARWRW